MVCPQPKVENIFMRTQKEKLKYTRSQNKKCSKQPAGCRPDLIALWETLLKNVIIEFIFRRIYCTIYCTVENIIKNEFRTM